MSRLLNQRISANVNQIVFSAMPACQDLPFAFEALCLAKRYLNVPNVVNIERQRIGSVSKNDWQHPSEEFFIKRIHIIKEGFRAFERIAAKVPFLGQHIDYRYAILDWFANHRVTLTLPAYANVPPFVLNEFVKRECQFDDAALTAYLFNTVNIQRLHIMRLQQELSKR